MVGVSDLGPEGQVFQPLALTMPPLSTQVYKWQIALGTTWQNAGR